LELAQQIEKIVRDRLANGVVINGPQRSSEIAGAVFAAGSV
jgi:hypothetical protein